MFKYILKRILISIPLLLGISLLTFFLMQLTPGNFFDTLKLNPQISPETIQRYEELYHLDKPVWEQYFYWLKNLFHGELGYSFFYNVPVSHLLGGRLWNTFVLSLAAFLFTWLIAIPLGIWAALRCNSWIDRGVQMFSYLALSTPSFFLAMMLLFIFSQSGLL
ncbi:MAG: ABC transporter permease, partial [Sedimentisphaerales bacterium]|nr:ABC transporter permease [Sedimentisphaerales bacterium]